MNLILIQLSTEANLQNILMEQQEDPPNNTLHQYSEQIYVQKFLYRNNQKHIHTATLYYICHTILISPRSCFLTDML